MIPDILRGFIKGYKVPQELQEVLLFNSSPYLLPLSTA